MIHQRGYTPQDMEACVQLRRSLDAAGEVGLDIRDLYQTHTHLEEPRSGRTRSLQQYMKVSDLTIKPLLQSFQQELSHREKEANYATNTRGPHHVKPTS